MFIHVEMPSLQCGFTMATKGFSPCLPLASAGAALLPCAVTDADSSAVLFPLSSPLVCMNGESVSYLKLKGHRLSKLTENYVIVMIFPLC